MVAFFWGLLTTDPKKSSDNFLMQVGNSGAPDPVDEKPNLPDPFLACRGDSPWLVESGWWHSLFVKCSQQGVFVSLILKMPHLEKNVLGVFV